MFRAPGRVNLIGEHTDYSGGLVLPAAIDRAVRVEAEPADERIILRSDRLPEPVDVPADGSEPPAAGWGRYVAAVAAELAGAGRPPRGLRGTVSSDLPDGAGLSSSAALEVAVATALCVIADFSLAPLELAAAAQRAEYRAVGVPCGIMDQAASVLGRAGHAVRLDCATLEHRLVPLPGDVALVVIDSGVPRRLEDSGYAARRAELETGLAAIAPRRPADLSLADYERAVAEANLGATPARRLRHVVSENARVRAAEEALAADGGPDRARLGELFAASHASLRDDYEVSTPELDLLVDLALDAGAFAARLTGAGFGGSILALAPLDGADGIGAAVAQRYTARAGFPAKALVCRPGDGAGEVPSTQEG